MTLQGTAPEAYQSKLYAEYSSLYDLVFARFFYPRIAAVIRELNIPAGSRVLELGVGTGLALRAYPRHCNVIGVDLAPDMLEHAQERIRRHGWRHINVFEMNAMALDFADSTFDYVMAFHVVSVVPDAGRFMREAQRVCKPGGKIVVINHFRSDKRVLAALDRGIEPITRRVGWHTLSRADVFEGQQLEVKRAYKTSRHSLFTIVVATNVKTELAAEQRAAAASVSAPTVSWVDRQDTAAH